MALIICPECSGKVSDKALQCPHCGCPISSIKEEIDEKTQNEIDRSNSSMTTAVVVVLVIFVLFVVFMVVKSSNSSHTSSNYSTSTYSSKDYTSSKKDDFDMEYYQQRNKDLKIEVTEVTYNSSYTTCDGKLTNSGNKSYEFIKLKGSFQDSSGNVVDTDWTYAVGSEGLSPGETTTFHLSVDKNVDIKDCKITFME